MFADFSRDVYGLSKETITAIMILYKNTNAMVRSTDRDKLLRDCCLSFVWRYISIISVYNLPRLHT